MSAHKATEKNTAGRWENRNKTFILKKSTTCISPNNTSYPLCCKGTLLSDFLCLSTLSSPFLQVSTPWPNLMHRQHHTMPLLLHQMKPPMASQACVDPHSHLNVPKRCFPSDLLTAPKADRDVLCQPPYSAGTRQRQRAQCWDLWLNFLLLSPHLPAPGISYFLHSGELKLEL